MRWRRRFRRGASLIDQGTAGLSDSLRKRVRITNAGALFGAVVMAATTPFDATVARPWMVVVNLVGTLLFVGVILANRRRHVTASRITLLVGGNLLAFKIGRASCRERV